MEIISKDNPLISEIRQLISQAKYRKKTGRFVIEGVRLCEDAVRSGVSVSTFVYTEKAKGAYPSVFAAVDAAAGRSVCVTEKLAALISDTQSPQGFFAVCDRGTLSFSLDRVRKGGRYLALENIQDPSNMGTMIRTAEAFGLDGLILSDDCCDITSPKVVRGSMGGVFRMPTMVCESFADALRSLQVAGNVLYACVPDRSADPIQSVDFSVGGIALIGNEANGLRTDTIALCDRSITIPMDGRAESLNAAVAASVVAWEMTR